MRSETDRPPCPLLPSLCQHKDRLEARILQLVDILALLYLKIKVSACPALVGQRDLHNFLMGAFLEERVLSTVSRSHTL